MAEPSGSTSTNQSSGGSAERMRRDRVGPADTPNYDERQQRIRLERRPAGPPLAPAREERARERPRDADDLGEPVDPADPS